MGVVNTISADRWPKQGPWLGCEVDVCFAYDLSCIVKGVIVRTDAEEPGRTIIRLIDSDRYVLAIECHYSPPRAKGTSNDE